MSNFYGQSLNELILFRGVRMTILMMTMEKTDDFIALVYWLQVPSHMIVSSLEILVF